MTKLFNLQWEKKVFFNMTLKELLIILFSAFIAITFFSKSSFLFPLNDWGDANCFMTVGKSLVHGKVLYRDIYEQKGPYLYFMHSLCSLISRTSFIGVYFLELIMAFIFLTFTYKTIKLFVNKSCFIKPIYLIPFISIFIYSHPTFGHGDSAEELCLGVLAWSLYIGIKRIKHNKIPTHGESILIGILASFVFWIKYTMVGLFVPIYIFLFVQAIRNKAIKEFFVSVFYVLLGLLVGSFPVLAYFAITKSFSYLWEAYFYNNLFLYSANTDGFAGNILQNVFSAFVELLKKHYTILIPIIIGLLGLIEKNKKIALYIIVSIIFTGFFQMLGKAHYLYYFFIFMLYVPLCAITISNLNFTFNTKSKHVLYFSLLCIFFLSHLAHGSNTYLMFEKKENMPQYKFKEIIQKEENPTLFCMTSLDPGFYTVCDIYPSSRFFCKLNFTWKTMDDELQDSVKNKTSKFIVKISTELKNSNYEEVAKTKFFYEGSNRTYYLYKLKNSD